MKRKNVAQIIAAVALISVSGIAHADRVKLPYIKPDRNLPPPNLPEIDTKLKIVHRQKASASTGVPITPITTPPGGVDNPDIRPVKPVQEAASDSATRKTGKGVVRNNNPPPHVPIETNEANQRGQQGGPVSTEPVKPPIIEPIRKTTAQPQ